MPTYEVVVIVKKLAKPELKTIIKRTAGYIHGMNSVIRKIEYLGLRATPYRMKRLTEANYFTILFDSSEVKTKSLSESLKRDVDIVKSNINFIEDKFRMKETEVSPCDIDMDMLDVPFRPHVQKMVEISKKKGLKGRKPFEFGGNRTYDPIGH